MNNCGIEINEIDYELMKRTIVSSAELKPIQSSSYKFTKLQKINIEQLNKKYPINDKTNISYIIDFALDRVIM